jgi:hypothetical protein
MSQTQHVTTWGATAAPTKSWVARHKLLAIALGSSGLLLLAGLFVVFLVTAVSVIMRSSDAYQLALNRAEHDPTLTAELGAPLHPGWLTTGEVSVHGPEGEASLVIPISGPRGSGKLNVRAHKSTGSWSFSELHVDVAGRSTPINLLSSSAGPP